MRRALLAAAGLLGLAVLHTAARHAVEANYAIGYMQGQLELAESVVRAGVRR